MLSKKRRNIQSVKDQGWAWIIVLGCWIGMFIIGGFSRSFGLLIDEVRDYLDVPIADVLTIKTALEVAYTIGGAVGVLLGEQFSCRLVVMVAGIIVFTGTALSSLLLNAPFMACTLGITMGLSQGLMLGNLFLMIPFYFEKKRSLAYGLSMTGSSIGQLTVPILIRYILDVYLIKGAFLILAAILFHMTLTGALLRPFTDHSLPKYNQQAIVQKSKCHTDENGTHDSLAIAYSSTGSALFVSSLSIDRSNIDKKSDSRCSSIVQKLRLMFDFTVLKNYLCLFLMLATFLTFTPTFLTSVFIVLNTNLSICKIDKVQTALLLTIVGGSDLVGRMICGVFTNFKLVQSYKLLSIACTLIGVNCILLSFATSYWWMALHSAIYGFFVAWYFTLVAIVSVELIGVEQLAKLFSLLLITEGIGSAVFVTLLGVVQDQTGSTFLVFIIMGILGMSGGILIWCCPLIKRLQARRSPAPISNDADEAIHVDSE